MKKWPEVSIIILNWNGWRDTIECLESLYGITYPNYVVVVVDNRSEDESVEKMKEWANGKIEVRSKFYEYNPMNKPIRYVEYDREEVETGKGEGKGTEENKEKEIEGLPSNRKLIIIKNEKNYGFAEGNNIGMRYALKTLNPDYILLLNNDTVVNKGFLVELIKVAESDEKIGIVGPKIYYYDRPNIIASAGGKINFFGVAYQVGEGEREGERHEKLEYSEWLTGTSLLLSRELICNIEGFDSDFFVFEEDLDLCLKAAKKGFKISYAPKAKIYHKGQLYTKLLPGYFSVRNGLIVARRHYSCGRRFLFFVYIFLYIIPRSLTYNVLSMKFDRALELIKAAKEGIKK